MAMEYHHFDTTTSLTAQNSWDSHAASTVAQRAIYIFWKPLPLHFIKVNFDSNVRGGAGFDIHDFEGKLLITEGSFHYEPSVLEVELGAVWTSIIWARQDLHADRILVNGDSTIIIYWIQDKSKQHYVHPLLCDVWHS